MSALLPRLIGDLVQLDAALARHLPGAHQLAQAVHRGAHHVVRVRRAQALGEDVGDAGALEYRAHRAAGDDTGTGGGGLEQHPPRAMLAHDLVRNGGAGFRQLHHRALGRVHGLPDRLAHLVGLAGGDTDLGLAVAHRHEGVEREPPAALHDLGHPVDGDHVLDVVALVLAIAAVAAGAAAATPITASAPATAAARPVSTAATAPALLRLARGRLGRRGGAFAACRLVSHLELQSAFARAVGDGLHATMVTVAGAVEHHPGHARRLGLLGQQLSDRLAAGDLALALDLDALAAVAHAEEGDAEIVVDQLGVDMLERAEHHQSRALGGAAHPLANPQVAAIPQL